MHASCAREDAIRTKPPRQLDFLRALEARCPSPEVNPGDEEVPDAEAASLLGFSPCDLRHLVANGALARAASGRVSLPPHATPRALHDAWLKRSPPRPTSSSIARCVAVRQACGLSRNAIPSDAVIRAAAGLLKIQMGTVQATELAALLDIKIKAARAAIRRLAVLDGDAADRAPAAGRPMTMDDIVARFPQLAGARDTCLDENSREVCEEPGPRSRARLAGTGALLAGASLFLLVSAAAARREERLEHHMLMLQRFGTFLERWHPGAGQDDEEAITDTLERIGFSEELDGVVREGVRDMICRSVLMLMDVTARYARSMDPDGSRGIGALVPARHSDMTGFRGRLRDQYRHLRAEARERRKQGTDPLADHLSVKTGAFWERMEQLGEIATAGRAAEHELLAGRHGPARYAAFSVEVAVLDDNGRHVCGHPEGHLQEERWRVWLEDDIRASLGLPPAGTAAQQSLPLGHDSEGSGDGDRTDAAPMHAAKPITRVYYERMGARPVLGDRAVKPWFVTLSDCGVLASPSELDRRMLRRRGTVLRTWSAPTPRSLPEGLVWFDSAGEDLWRRAIARGRSLVPIIEFETGAMFAELGCNAVLESMCRGNAFMQMEDNADAWPVDESEETHAGLCFAAIEKTAAGADPVFAQLPVLDQTLLDAREVAARVAAAAGSGDTVPDVLIEPRYRWKRPHPRPFIFQWNGRALTLSEVNHILRLLFANIIDATFHDFRHACATDLYDECRWPEVVKRSLGQTTGVWRHYARLTPRMRRRDKRRQQQERLAKAAQLEWDRRLAA